jgi:hypothetical protein
VGVIKGELAKMKLVRSSLEIVVVGILSAGDGFALGSLPHLFGY